MILRRVIAHFRKQEWTAIGLDFLIVVVGVFIGIQVSNWNDARAERSIADHHLTEIAEDLQAHLGFHDALYGSAVGRIAAVDLIYERAFGSALPDKLTISTETLDAPPTPDIPDDVRDNIMGWVNLVRITVSSRNGYESLTSSGHLGLIENRDLARQIQVYYGQYDDLLDTQQLFRTFRNDGVREMYAYGVSAFDERPLDEIVALARDNPAFAAYLRTNREWAILHAALLQTLRVETEALIAAIDSELKR